MKRREPFPDLAHVLDDMPAVGPPPAPPAMHALPVARDKRVHNRFDKAFPVMIGSELYGDTFAIARNLSAGGILVEMSYAPPLGTVVTVHFQHARGDDLVDELIARAEVKHHHYLNFSHRAAEGGAARDAAGSRAIGLRFLEFIAADDAVSADRLH